MFRVGDIVERFVNVPVEGLNGPLRISSISPSGSHISLNGKTDRYSANLFKLIKPGWKVGDRAKVTKHGPNFGYEFEVMGVSGKYLLDAHLKPNFYLDEICERVALAPAPAEPSIMDSIGSPPIIEFKTTLARELEIPTYLYDVLEVKPRLKSGVVQVGATTVDIRIGHNGVSLFNLDVNNWSAEDLRKLAKLCTDLADLMG